MSEVQRKVQELSGEFDSLCLARVQMGAKQYGPVAFLDNDLIQMAAEELADLANYARMLYVKLRILGEALDESGFHSTNESAASGAEGFVPSGSGTFTPESH